MSANVFAVPKRGKEWRRYPAYKDSGNDWLGSIPEHWNVKRLKYVVKRGLVNGLFKKKEHFGTGVKLINVVNLYREDFLIDFASLGRVAAEDTEVNAYAVSVGDIFFVRSSLKREGVGVSARISEVPEPTVFECHLVKVTPSENMVSADYMSKFLNSTITRHRLIALSETTTMTTIAQPKLSSLEMPVPPPPEQQAIAAFLDRQMVRIDALIAKREELIALLEEKRTALISRAVTKGLDPTVPMRESGIEWLGKIPAHWKSTRLKYLAKSLQTGPFGTQLHAEQYIEDGIPVINPANIEDGRIIPNLKCTVDRQVFDCLSRHRLDEGDIVFARRGEMGRCALVSKVEDGWLCGTGCLRVRPDTERAYPPFLSLRLSAKGAKDWFVLESVGSTMENLNTEIIGEIPVAAPNVDEQRRIAEEIAAVSCRVDIIIVKNQEAIEKLREYRTALISAAVTGKIDVRGEVQ